MHWEVGGYRPCDIEVVTAFEQHVLPYPPESPVRLSDGTLAIVVTPSAPDDPLMPVIRAGDGKEYNLSEYMRTALKDSGLYTTDVERNERPQRKAFVRLRRRKRRAKRAQPNTPAPPPDQP